MTQTRLFKPAKREKTILSQSRDFDSRNLESAKLMLEDVEQFGGEASGRIIWARAVVARLGGQQAHQ